MLTPGVANQLGLNVSSGTRVVRVVPGSPAGAMGITRNAAITAAEGRSIATANDLGQVLHAMKLGQQVSVTWVDESGTHSQTGFLMSGPAV